MIRKILEKFKSYSITKKSIVICSVLALFLAFFPLPMKCSITGGVIASHGDPSYNNTTGGVYFPSDPDGSDSSKVIHTCSPLFPLMSSPSIKREYHPILFPEFEAMLLKQIRNLYDPYGDASPKGEKQVIRIHLISLSYPVNYADNSILMGASHDVFVGKILTQVSNKDFAGNIATQFRVEVLENIKGDLKDTVIVNQEGGEKDGELYLIEDSNGLLQPGFTYLLSTRYDPEGDYHTLNPHENASKLLSSDANINKKELKALVDKDAKVKSLEAAYPNEELLQADVYHANTRNNFAALPADMKAAAQTRAEQAKTGEK